MHTNISRLINKEMDRKEFLKYGAGVALAVVGITGLLNTLFNVGGTSESEQSGFVGYGGSTYGR